jgi:uncharacterized membrane protein YgdD (TMEM256/DUF423 family)
MSKIFLIFGCLFGALSVMIGAFGAHALKAILEANNRLDTFETAVKYQFYHSFALILLGILMQKNESQQFNLAGYLFIGGILIFSGSLYILSITGLKWLGAITPIGGLAMIGGWLVMAWILCKSF